MSLSTKDRTLGHDAFWGVWLHVLSEWNLPVCVKPWNKIMQECRYKMNTQRGYVLHFSVGFTEITWVILILSSCFSSSSPWKCPSLLQGHVGICLVPFFFVHWRALCVAFSVCMPESSGVCIFLQCCFITYQGNTTHSISLFYSNGMIGTVE